MMKNNKSAFVNDYCRVKPKQQATKKECDHVGPLTAGELAEVLLLACFVMGFGALLIS